MRRRFGRWMAVLAAVGFVPVAAAAQGVDDILAANLEARASRQVRESVRSVRLTSVLDMAGGEAAVVVYAQRPNLLRQELTVAGQTIVNVFDGSSAWVLNPLAGVNTPTVVAGVEAEAIRRQAGFEGPLQAARAAGDRIELVGRTLRRGRPVHQLRITSDQSHAVQYAFVDVETALEQAVVSRTSAGWFEAAFSDYRDVQGLRIPFLVSTTLDGRPQSVIRVTAIDVNVPIDRAMFGLSRAVSADR